MTFKYHVSGVVRAFNCHLGALWHRRRSMPFDVAKTSACSIMGSRLEYCNSLLYGAEAQLLRRHYVVQSIFSRTVLNVSRTNQHVSNILRELHWLPIQSRIEFKITLLSYKAYQTHEPSYLSTLLKPYTRSRSLKSCVQDLLVVQSARLKSVIRGFLCAEPRISNVIPITTRLSDSITGFKSHLKTYLFRISFGLTGSTFPCFIFCSRSWHVKYWHCITLQCIVS